MANDCCGPLIPAPDPDAVPNLPREEAGSGNYCNASVADTEASDATNSGQGDTNQDPQTGCCFSGEHSSIKVTGDIDVPHCCRGKTSPCCDTSCLERLALRECAISAVAPAGANARTKICSGASEGKACNKHNMSTLDRFEATLRTLGCICRDLIALGQETCCETRERRSLDGKRSLETSPPRSFNRKSLDSCNRSGSARHDQAARRHLRLRKGGSGENIKSPTKNSSVVVTTSSCCSTGKPMEQTPNKSRAFDPRCSEMRVVEASTIKESCAKPCCSTDKPTEQTIVEIKRAHASYSGGAGLEEYLPAVGCPGSCCPGDKNGNDDDTKTISVEMPCSGINYVVESSPGGCEGNCCGSANITVVKEKSNRARDGPCCKPRSLQSIDKVKTDCAGVCCSRKRAIKSRSSCVEACCPSVSINHGVQAEITTVQVTADTENQSAGTEHVVLSISGMTCTGCETKLNRTLATVPAVKDLKTSLVLSRAEFTIDLRLASVEDVVKHLERTTEFKCERVQNQGASLDVIIPGEPSKFMSQSWPDGVIDLKLVERQTVRAVFDPKLVGARDLVEKIWGPPIELAPPRGDPSLDAGNKHVRHVGYMTLLSVVLTIPVLVMAWAPLPDHASAYNSASFALATIVQVVIAGPFYPKALKALVFSRVIEMDLLIVLSTTAAYVFSVVSFGFFIAGSPLSTGQFFETSTLLVTLIMVGRWVAALARQKAVASISIQSLQASRAILVDKEGGTDREIDARLLQYGDIFKVLPDAKLPTDGTVITGSSEVDESMLTGESRPVEKYPGSVVIAGSTNGFGALTVRLNRLPGDNTIHTIAAMVDEARLSKPKLQSLADRVASYFVPVVVALTIFTFVIWVAVGVTVQAYGGSEATVQAITYAITVLIVSCPCAIGLAVPMVIVIVSGAAAERGVIFKSADAIEVAYKTSHVVFDKTGTLTRGKLSVVEAECVDQDKLPLLRGLVESSQHPVSAAVAAHLKHIGVPTSVVHEPKSLTGKGVETTLDGQKLRAGNSRWLNLSDHELVQPMLAQGYTVFCFTIDGEVQAVYGLEDDLRSDAAETIQILQKRGISVHVVSGDDDGAVQALASKLDIPDDNVRSRSSPADKRDYIKALLGPDTDSKKPVVVFCGDGTNDAIALAQATIGVHMNEGTDVAQSAADVVLMRPSLAGILTMMNASRKSVHRIKFNFGWSFVYNTFAVLLAAGAFVNARIPPEFAGLGELVSVLPVIAAAVLLRWSKI